MDKQTYTVSAGTRLYYFDIHKDRNGAQYLSVTEMNLRTKLRSCIHVWPESVEAFAEALKKMADTIKKEL